MAKKPARVLKLYSVCKAISNQGRAYVYGGGHGLPLGSIPSHAGLDCSSSTCMALHRVGLYAHNYATASSGFKNWGAPGKGKWFTVWYNAEHVWIQFHRVGKYWRFDTSPWGWGGRGPKVRIGPRSTTGFTPRHYPGL
jgi:hypothetical protein